MKTIGLIGGTSWVSTAEYYRLINEEINRRVGGVSSASCLIHSFNYSVIDKLNKSGDYDSIGNLVLEAAIKLEVAGADCILLCANSLHMHCVLLEEKISIPLIHIARATAKEINKQQLTKVGLLGTKSTMEKDFYRNRLQDYGINVFVPEREERDFIHTSIMTELILKNFREETKERFLNIISQLEKRGAEGIVLGCTEIPLLIKQEDISIPALNTLKLHAMAGVDFALQ